MNSAAELKAEVVELSRTRTHRAQRYPEELRKRLEAETGRLRDKGLTWHEASKELGVRAETLERWLSCNGKTVPAAPVAKAVLPVEVVRDTPRAREALTVVTPSGWRVEGATLKQVARLLKALA